MLHLVRKIYDQQKFEPFHSSLSFSHSHRLCCCYFASSTVYPLPQAVVQISIEKENEEKRIHF